MNRLFKSPLLTALCMSLLVSSAWAQKGSVPYEAPSPYADYKAQKIQITREFSEVNSRSVKDWVATEFNIDANDLELLDERTSPMGYHFHYQQMLNGTPLYHKKIKVNIGLDKSSVLAFYDLAPGVAASSNSFPQFTQLPSGLPAAQLEKVDPIYWVDGDRAFPAAKLLVEIQHHEHRLWIVDSEGQWLDEEWLSAHYCDRHSNESVLNESILETDTNISVMVFNPDPLTTAGVTYGGNYTDMNDQNQAFLDPERVMRTVLADYSNGTYNLTNYAVTIVDVEGPTDSVAARTDDMFHYSRSEQEFNQVNCFYHITEMKMHLEALGLTNLMNYSISVDANAFFGQDNSRFEYGNQTLFFGNGGVDDAEDADVIIHEYQHAMSYDAAPNTNSGTERRCLDEANGDYYAASYSKHINPFSYEKVFTWDGHNEFWSGRDADNPSNKYYPNISFNGGIYQHTDLWSAALMDIWDQLGRDTADFLIGCSLYGYSSSMTFPDAAALIIMCDDQHFQGGHRADLCAIFGAYGILDPCDVSINELEGKPFGLRGTLGFSNGGVAYLNWEGNRPAQLEMYNAAGQLLSTATVEKESTFEISSEGLSPGVYVVRILDANGQSYSFKLSRN